MKTFNKVFGGLILGFGVMATISLFSPVSASVVARAPKAVFVSSYTTGLVQITANSSTSISGILDYLPGAVYQVILGSGAPNEYFMLYDSTGTVGITCGNTTNGANQLQLGPKWVYSSTITVTTPFVLDPPFVFHNGLVACDSASTGQAAVTYETGRGLSGN